MTATAFRSWGGLSARGSQGIAARSWLAAPQGGPALPFGLGRSYGDSCLLDGGRMIDASGLDRIESLDAESGELVAEAGVTLGALLERIVPAGFFLPVTPGTRFVTLGGAAANDVHGKNHHAQGSFGRHVRWLELARSDGSRLICSPGAHPDLFAATIGGMGLTGLITRLCVRLLPIGGARMVQDTLPFANLREFFALAAESDASHDYTVAWLDSLAAGPSLGRGVFFRANHEAGPGAPFEPPRRPLPFLPFTPPMSLVNGLTMRLFNAAYRAANRRERRGASVPFAPFFYPLDAVGGWSRAYGPGGLRQFQCVVPLPDAQAMVSEMLTLTHRAGAASFLTVLKLFGDKPSPGLMSFPMPGATLTLDFAYRGAATDRLLAQLDAVAIAAGGRVNPYKDARMPAAVFEASFPRWRAFAAHVDPGFSSNFWRRVTGG